MDRKTLAAVSASALVGAALLGSAPAQAQQQADMRVGFAGVDLRSEAGSAQALRRIVAAANVFCENTPGNRSLARRAEARACAKRMTFLAVRELDAPLVTARYDKRTASPVLLARR